ncbi:efflux transporter outer membrane subunit [Herbaspirillum sp. RTI4]|uniref:efflux transporter outer membrane subunit n=1 Tax=Herbaspirillum sp. RTI4 TaxID=3048640 RepID=UPI002AB392BD|nr:efflux transporter outer membrane subunit [Herbaspirillum sp. RTI4]MDY7577634.1 efflux transporter outer membrane subunit [Herbaspirillum sp. RTI4]MEA9982200.1 efflux transporter outer membrane subunit [Herbaspirillum sp. RTI4]
MTKVLSLGSIRTLSSALLLAGLLSACSLAPTYERPAAPVNASYPASAEGKAGLDAVSLGWRQFFPDQRLQALITAALANNRDLRTTALNIEEARAQYNITGADLLPNLNATGNAARTRTSASQSVTGQPYISNSYQVGMSLASFELDFFGRVRSLNNAALATYLATEEAQLSARISLISQVAQAYLAERSYAEQLTLAQQTLESRVVNMDLAKRRFDVGASSALDLRLAETLVQSARVSAATLARQRAQADNALTLLVGTEVASLPANQTLSSQKIVTDIPAGLPSDLLTRRPDIRAAEQTLRAANANIGAARAAFFPRISLTGSYGSASSTLGNLFTSGSGAWAFSPQLSLPIFDAGRNSANLTIAEVRKNIAIAAYEKTIQVAFREVSDALVARGSLEEQITAQEAYLAAEQDRLNLTELRYTNGIASALDRLDAQRDLFSAQQALVQARQLRLNNAIDLYRALGGGLNEVTATTPAVAAK